MEQLFKNYLQNQCTTEEIREVLQHLKTSEGRQLMERLLADNPSEATTPEPTAEQVQQGWQKLSAYISSNTENPVPAVRVLSLWPKRALRVAAVLLPLLVGSYLVWQNYFNHSDTITVKTQYAEVKRIILPDESVVTLNGNSSLTYQADWKAFSTREVWLQGEGFFEVTHQQNHQKFLVHTRRAHTVEVLGTEFNVSDRSSATQVALKSGKIRLTVQQNDEERSLVMKPGQKIAIDSSAKKLELQLVKTENVAMWRENKLVFEATQLREIAQMLKETYNLDVNVDDERLLQERITGTIPSGSVKELLSALSAALRVKYIQENNQVKFY